MKQVLCMKWGRRYGAEYVNRLYSMVQRNVTGEFRFLCLTDDRNGICDEVECFPCPAIDLPHPQRNAGWRKVTLWKETVPGAEEGDVLFLDLDIVITGNIDAFFDHPGDFVVCRNWSSPGADNGIGNTSVYRFRVGSHPYLYHDLIANQQQLLAEFSNSQTYQSRCIRQEAKSFWPEEWCRSFKVHCIPKGIRRYFIEPVLPEDTRIVIFPGVPNPHEAAAGQWPAPWYKQPYKHIRPSTWVRQNWV